jgi:hypothetical protein
MPAYAIETRARKPAEVTTEAATGVIQPGTPGDLPGANLIFDGLATPA